MNEDLTKLVLDRAHSAVIWIDEVGRVTYWNPSAERAFGISGSEALGRPVAEMIIPERLRPAHHAGFARFLAEGVGPVLDQRIEVTALRADGSEFPVEMTISALEHDGGWLFSAFVQDVSWRQGAERERERLIEELRHAVHAGQRRLDTIVGSLSDAVTIRDRNHRIIYANGTALARLGFASLHDLQGSSPQEIMAEYTVLGEDGREISMGEIPSVRILRGESANPLLIRTIHSGTGVERWDLLKAAPLLNEDGDVEATIMVVEDVSDQKRTERSAAFLARASEVLASSLDYERTLRNVAQLAVPDVVDWCAVDLLDDKGVSVPVAVAHVDPARLAVAEQLRAYRPSRLDPNQGLGLVLRTGKAVLHADISDEMLRRGAVDDRHLELLRSAGLRSAVVVPMRLGHRTIGTMTMVSAESGRLLNHHDVELAEQLASRAAVAIENSRLYSERSRIAHTLQQSLLPQRPPRVPGFEIATAYVPAVAGTQVGGDFYDAWEVSDGWMVTVGDVTGKGVEAATLTALVRHTMRATSEFVTSPAELLTRLDGTLRKQEEFAVCTAVCMFVQTDCATIAVGGHPLPLYITAERVTELGEHGPLLGGFRDGRWRNSEVSLSPGATVVMYTDGITDARGKSGARYGLGRLRKTLARYPQRPAAELVTGLIEALSAFQDGPQGDDVAVLALHRSRAGAVRRDQDERSGPIAR